MQHPEFTKESGDLPASGVGNTLQRAREARGMTMGDAAHALKLTLRQVEALETDHFEHLPGTAFARGFLRNYARLLGLDDEALVAQFEARHGGPAVELRELSNARGALPSASGGRSRPSAVPAALVAALLLAVVVAGWYFDWFRQSPLPEAELRAPVAAAAGTAVAVTAVVTPLAAPPVAAGVPSAEANPPAAAPGAAPPEVPPAVALVPAAAASVDVSPAALEAGVVRLGFSFVQEAWVEVRDGSGKIIYSRISPAGAAQEVMGHGPFNLVVGNAQNVKVTRNGEPVDLVPHTKVSVARLTLP